MVDFVVRVVAVAESIGPVVVAIHSFELQVQEPPTVLVPSTGLPLESRHH